MLAGGGGGALGESDHHGDGAMRVGPGDFKEPSFEGG